MTGSSMVVVGEGEGGGGLLVAPVEERAVPALRLLECLERVGAGIGGVLGGGGVAKVVVIVVGWMTVEGWWVSNSLGSSLTLSSLTSGKSGCSGFAAGMVYGSLWSSSSTEGLGSQSGESRSIGMKQNGREVPVARETAAEKQASILTSAEVTEKRDGGLAIATAGPNFSEAG